jgi:hypothetical protein
MTCYHPLQAWPSKIRNENGKRQMVFKRSEGISDKEKLLPCGKCIGCRLERALQMSIRCQHEAEYWSNVKFRRSSFITLTISPAYPEKEWSVNKRDFQLFMKRLRKKYTGKRIPYYAAGGYGEDNDRPHYHAILFGHQFEDMLLGENDRGQRLYRSEILSEIWPYGECVIGDVTFESINYVVAHLIKILSGEKAEVEYKNKVKPFQLSSRNPAIGKKWYEIYKEDMYNNDELVIRDGFIHKPPRYYDKLRENETLKPVEQLFGHDVMMSLEMEVIRKRREKTAVQRAVDVDRRYAKEYYKLHKQKLKKIRRGKNV